MPRYLTQLYKRRRPLFFVVLAFCVGQGFFMVKGVETVPFFLFGMYSEPMPEQVMYSGIMVEEDGEALDLSSLPGLRKDMIITPVERYLLLSQQQFEDPILPVVRKRFEDHVPASTYFTLREHLSNAPADRPAFYAWFRSYLEATYGRPMGTLRVYQVGGTYGSKADEAVFFMKYKQILFES